MQNYRKRFIWLNLILIGTVLIIVLTAVGIYMGTGIYSDIESTMRQVISPFSSSSIEITVDKPALFPSQDSNDDNITPPSKPDDDNQTPPSKPNDNSKKSRRRLRSLFDLDYSKNITAVLYSKEKGITILSDSSDLSDTAIQSAVSKVINFDKNFGKITDLSLYYYVNNDNGYYRIALASTLFVTTPIIELILILIAIFAVAMVIFYIISFYISKIAVKPLEQSMEMEKQFVADVSHDLKTPITVILANNSILKSNESSTVAEQKQWIDSTDNAAHNMLNMISEMLTLSQMESKEINVEISKIDVSHTVNKISLQMESLAFDKGINYITDIDDSIYIDSNKDYVERICSGLISNAMKYEAQNGNIIISLHKDKKKALLKVRNTSTVIDKKDIDHVFERFYRGDKARDTKSGHGLGLSITKRMTELINAKIFVESKPDTGTEFTVEFNICD